MKKAIFMPVVLLVSVFFTLNASAEMYKWTDKRGEVHYTQTPPPPDAKGKDIEDDIRLSTGKLGNNIPAQADKSAPKDDMDKAHEAGEKSDKKHRDFCAQQEAALKQMTANALIKWKDEKGERFLTADEKTGKMKEMQGNIDTMCKPEMFSKTTDKPTSQTEKTLDARLNPATDTSTVSKSNASTQGNNPAANTQGNTTTSPSAAAMLPAAD
ncbi:MAG: hypothetical protein BWK73_37880 [Thiothrix lacustris]|uniref:DUF4124 domain-containing protein n=1 Tax=Thiothrix lacustris TaxID=525917 RepID=A0A1Y1QEN4_9GAMM|nr:MAG: hypothetical protein BWK73_37880 [Thiothrix lacustris]